MQGQRMAGPYWDVDAGLFNHSTVRRWCGDAWELVEYRISDIN